MVAGSSLREYPQVYGLWANEGGVGKTTLAFHLATTYAKLCPDKKVVVIDMSPQCHLSAALLTRAHLRNNLPVIDVGDAIVHQYQETAAIHGDTARTVAGFISCELNRAGSNISIDQWLVPVHKVNLSIPDNLLLLCGDSFLDFMVDSINSASSAGPILGMASPYQIVMSVIRTFIRRTHDHFSRTENKEIVVFIDTILALSAYTQMALVAMTEVIVPVSADYLTVQAVCNLFHPVYGLYPRTVGPAAQHEPYTFASKARSCGLPVPQVCCIVHNKNPAFKNKSNDGAVGFIPPKGFHHMTQKQARSLYNAYIKATALGQRDRVFRPNDQPDGVCIDDIEQFSRSYTGTMRDMLSCGVASLHTGLPLWELVQQQALIPRHFRGVNFQRTVPYLVRDVLLMLKLLQGEAEYSCADQAALDSMPQVPANAPPEQESDDEDDDIVIVDAEGDIVIVDAEVVAGTAEPDSAHAGHTLCSPGPAVAASGTTPQSLTPIHNPQRLLKWHKALAPVYQTYDVHNDYLLHEAPTRFSDFDDSNANITKDSITSQSHATSRTPYGSTRVLLVACMGFGTALKVLAAGLVRTAVLLGKAQDQSEEGHRALVQVTATHLQYNIQDLDPRNLDTDLAFFLHIRKVNPNLPVDVCTPFRYAELIKAAENRDINQAGKLYWPIAGLMFHEPDTATPAEQLIADGGLEVTNYKV